MVTDDQRQVLVSLAKAMVASVVDVAPHPAPAGPMFIAWEQSLGLGLDRFSQLMDGLVGAGLLTYENHCYQVTDKGREFAQHA